MSTPHPLDLPDSQTHHLTTKSLNTSLKSLFLSFDEFPHFVLPKSHFDAIKTLFKKDASLVRHAYDKCLIYLARRDSRVRFRCLLFLKQIVARSPKTRTWLESDFNDIIEKCIIGEANGGDSQLVNSGGVKKSTGKKKLKISSNPNSWQKQRRSVSTSKFIQVRILPEPAGVATELRDLALRTVEEWNDVYGALYPKITIGYNYLKNVLLLKFPDVRAENVRMAKEKKEREEYAQRIVQAKYVRVKKEFADNVSDMVITLKEAEEILRMIVPDFDTLFQRALEDPNYKREDMLEFLKQHGGVADSSGPKDDFTTVDQTQSDLNTTSSALMNESSVSMPRWSTSTHPTEELSESIEELENAPAETNNEGEEEDEWENVATSDDAPVFTNTDAALEDDNFDLGADYEDLLGSVSGTGRDVKVSIRNTISDLKTKENKEIVEALEEKMREIMKTYKPMLDDWNAVITKVSVSDKEKREYDQIYKHIIDLKRNMDAQIRKCTDLHMDLSFADDATKSGKSAPQSFYSVPQMSADELARKRKRTSAAPPKGIMPSPKRRKTKLI